MQNEWYVQHCGDEICTLANRDTGEVATVHLDELKMAQGAGY